MLSVEEFGKKLMGIKESHEQNATVDESSKPKRVLWFSRHIMTPEQLEALGNVEVKQVNATIAHASELSDEINQCDIIAIVAPLKLQAEFIKISGGRPVIMAVSERVLIHTGDGAEDKVEFRFKKWERLIRIDILKEDYIPS